MERLTVAGTEVLVTRGLPAPLLPPRPQRSKMAIVTQPAATGVAVEIAEQGREEGVECEVIGVPDRDEAKTIEVATSVYEGLARFGLTRHDTVAGVGGGSATDLAGFVAGTWMRGVEAVHFPTTLLGAVDAAIGGKTGLNLGGKNLVGVLWHPSRVCIDLDILESLPAPLVREGMAEALKMGFVADPELAGLLVEHGLEAPLEAVIDAAVAAKGRIVEADERERGPRALLNFGHTIGHAVEYASSLSHGESVAVGMAAAAEISTHVLGFNGGDLVHRALVSLGLPTRVDGLDQARVRDLIQRDKKRDAGGLRMVLLEEVGSAVLESIDPVHLDIGFEAIGLGPG